MAPARSVSPPDDSRLGSPAPPISKRDKRRTVLTERLRDMVSSFNANIRPHYDAQVNAIQVDIKLIEDANLLENKPLEDAGEKVAEMVTNLVGFKVPAEPVAEEDFYAQAGRWYSRFAREVNNAMEARDVNLTLLGNKFDSSLREYEAAHRYKVRLAEEEHKALAETIRARLIQSVNQKKAKLMREKEQLDIGDSNALLLHPSQFSIAHPASPGGPTAPRKTRHARNRIIDPDELPSAAAAQENRRKRKAAFEDLDNGSPTPASRHADAGNRSPYRDARARVIYHQQEAPVYTVDKLFTEKELAMNMNNAAMAAQHFLMTLKNQPNGTATNGSTSNHVDGDDSGPSTTNDAADGSDDATPPAAPDMDRTVSHHATRGATRSALGLLATAAEGTLPATTPFILPLPYASKANATAPPPPPIPPNEADADLAFMTRASAAADTVDDAAAIAGQNDRLLAAAVAPPTARHYEYRPPSFNLESADLPAQPGGFAAHLARMGVGGVPMSAQSSVAPSEAGFGGVAMSRNGSATGGAVVMKRTASAAGTGPAFLGEGGRRGRRREG